MDAIIGLQWVSYLPVENHPFELDNLSNVARGEPQGRCTWRFFGSPGADGDLSSGDRNTEVGKWRNRFFNQSEIHLIVI